jgi:predicted PurR-regulated permease PerM
VVRRLPRQREAEVPEPLVSGWDTRSVALVGIFGLLFLWMLYFARDILVPIAFAFVLNLLLQPAARWFVHFGIPKPIAALLTLFIFLGLLFLFGVSLVGPLSAWVAKAPESLPRLEGDLWALRGPLEKLQSASKEFERLTGTLTGRSNSISVAGPGIGDFLFTSTRAIAAGLGTMIVVLYFLLLSGDLFLRR